MSRSNFSLRSCSNAQLVQRLREEVNTLSRNVTAHDIGTWYLGEIIDEVEKRMAPKPPIKVKLVK